MPSTDSLFGVHKVWLRKSFAAESAFSLPQTCAYRSCSDRVQLLVSMVQPFPKRHQRLPMIEFSPYSPPGFVLTLFSTCLKIWHKIGYMSILFTDKFLITQSITGYLSFLAIDSPFSTEDLIRRAAGRGAHPRVPTGTIHCLGKCWVLSKSPRL
jgi:hypothetical protein